MIKHKALIFLLIFASLGWLLSTQAPAATENKLLGIMQDELNYNFNALQNADSIPLYFLSYQIFDDVEFSVSAELGVVETFNHNHGRYLDVVTRVGSYNLDNTHEISGGGGMGAFNTGSIRIPLENDENAIKLKIWNETEKKYKAALKRYTNVLTAISVNVEAEDQSDDFSHEQPQSYIGDEVSLDVNTELWRDRVKRYSAIFMNHPEIENSSVTLSSRSTNSYFISSEGTKIQDGLAYIRLSVSCNTVADDGMQLSRFESFDAADFNGLPGDDEVIATIQRLIKEINELKGAPLAEPYTGPAILLGRASGVFFHEIFGHRMEGFRQKSESEGQTFTKKVGELILPDFISVISDPTLRKFGDIDLRGFYRYDDEGIKGQRVTLVDHGILKNFMMSRAPINNFPQSNGHGRKNKGFDVVSRQSNLIVESDKTVKFDELKQQLIEECKRQNKPYGLIFHDISGGFTMTQRFMPQSFKVLPLYVTKIYVDDGHEEVIRGVDIVGTPLTSFSKIILAADDPDVFNGTCGAQSGWVPVSAISPSLLLSEIEIERSQKGQDRPPLLPSPVEQQQ